MILKQYEAEGFFPEAVSEFCLESKTLRVTLLSYGATVTSIQMKNHNGCWDHLTMTLQDSAHYRNNPLYAGATLAPNAGRISGGQLPLPDKIYTLSQNDGAHQLHGGIFNLSHCCWKVEGSEKTEVSASVTFSCLARDGLDGYPGSRRFTACYTLDADNSLTVRYTGESDQPTYINMSNHTYFHLGGGEASVMGHRLWIDASRYTELTPDHIPKSVAACQGTPFDFSIPHTLEEQTKKYPGHPQLEIGHGYNHGFLLDGLCRDRMARPSLILEHTLSKRSLQVFTDAPCLVLYSGGFIGTGHLLEQGNHSSDSCALAIECQDVPDAPGFLPGQMKLTAPGQAFSRVIRYRFLQE